MASPAASWMAAARTEQPLLPEEILESIFLLLESGRDLARASGTSRAFRRVATGRRFLRRFTSLHPPPVVGFVFSPVHQGLYLAERPHPSAPAARAVAQAGDYSFSFLPNDSPRPYDPWSVQDFRGGRFLLSRDGTDASTFLELVVCDPLYRRYVQIPPIPGDLVPRMPPCGEMKSEPFLAPADEGESEEDSHFRVIYNWVSNYKIASFVFSAVTGKWCLATSFSFLPARLILEVKELKRYYARSCFYWVDRWNQYMLVLDPCEMKFSIVLHGKCCHRTVQGLAIVDAAEDRLGLLTLDRADRACCTLNLYTRTCDNNGIGAEEWRHDKVITLPEHDHKYLIIGAAEGYLFLRGSRMREEQILVVNLETLLVERFCMLNWGTYGTYQLFASFPPPLSLPTL